MIVLIDSGNTRIKCGWLRSRSAEREAAALTLNHGSLDELAAWLGALPEAPARAIGANVAGTAKGAAIEEALRRHAGITVRWVRGDTAVPGLRNGYDDATQLGPDRWASLAGLAAHAESRLSEAGACDAASPWMLASFGTATTVDTLAPEPAAVAPAGAKAANSRYFVGGLIFPGPELMRSSLAAGTANLPAAQGGCARFPTHTHDAIISGILAAQAGAVLRQWRACVERFGRAPQVVASGGGWPLVHTEVERVVAQAHADLDLPPQPVAWLASPVLDGLARMAGADVPAVRPTRESG